jgi:hypothetical protein
VRYARSRPRVMAGGNTLQSAAFLLIPVIGLFFPAPLRAIDAQRLDIAIKSVESQGPPFLLGDILILSHEPDSGSARFVGARFAHESFAVLHPFVRNEYGVFVLGYPVPEGVGTIRYRIVVDGLWMSDPANPDTEPDSLGNPISLFRIEKEIPRSVINPAVLPDGAFLFLFRSKSGRRISISGDFNNWEPFIDYLSEIPGKPGWYSIRLRIKPGAHYYFFFSDGTRILDPFNPETATDPGGNEVSYFLLPS